MNALAQYWGQTRCWCRRHWVISLVAAGFLTLSGLALTGLALFGVFVWMPAQTYSAMSTPEWEELNVRLMGFTNPKDFEVAEKQLLLRASKEKSPVSHYLLGSLYQTINRPQEALQQYRTAVTVSKNGWFQETANQYITDDAYAAMALLRYESGQPTIALSDLNHISDLSYQQDYPLLFSLKNALENPDRADFHFDLAKELRQQLKFPQAQRELDLALRLSTDPATRVRIENYQKSTMPSRIVSLNPYVRYLCLAGNAHGDPDQGGSLKQAVAFYEAASEQDPNFELVYQQLASVYKDMGDYNKASSYASIAIRKNPQQYLSYVTLGNIALATEHYEQAITHFTQAQGILATLQDDDHTPLLANVENQLGFSYELLEDGQSALTHYEQAFKLTSASDDENQDYAYAQDGIKRAKALIQKATQVSKIAQAGNPSLIAARVSGKEKI